MAYTTKSQITAIGTGKFFTAPKTADPLGATWVESFHTLKDSVKLEQAAGTPVEVFIDQNELPIYSITKAGKFTLTFVIPNMSTAMLTMFFNSGTNGTGTAPAGYEATGIKMNSKPLDLMFKLELAESEQIWIFHNLSISKRVSGGTLNTAPAGIEVVAEIMANPDPLQSDVIILNKMAGTGV